MFSNTYVKLSVALMLLKIKPEKAWRRGLTSLIAILTISVIGMAIAQLLMCRPIRASWNVILRLNPGNFWDVNTQVIVSNSLISMYCCVCYVLYTNDLFMTQCGYSRYPSFRLCASY
jgi:hypothetical protein